MLHSPPTLTPTPLPPVAREWSTECASMPRAVALARTRARTSLTVLGWTGDIDDAVLVVSELVTNAVRHARLPGRTAWLRLAVLEDGGLLVDVSDPVAGFMRGTGVDVPPDKGGECGRGLRLVCGLGELSWFLRADAAGGKTVRVHMACERREREVAVVQSDGGDKLPGKPWSPPPDPKPTPDGGPGVPNPQKPKGG